MRKDKKIFFTIGPIGVCILLATVGILLVICSNINFENPYVFWAAWGKSTSNSLGTTLVASAVVSLILEISNLKSFFSGVLGNVLGDDFPLEAYSEENLENFHMRLICHLCNLFYNPKMTVEQLKNSLYLYEKTIRENVTSVYYEYHTTKYFFTPDESNGLFKVRAEITYKLINKYSKPNSIRFRLKTYCLDGKDGKEDYKNNFDLQEFSINDKPAPKDCVKVEDIPKYTNKSYYDYKIKIEKKLDKEKENTIKLTYEYRMSMSDISQSYKVTLPCKRLEHEFKIFPDITTNKKWALQAVAFAPFFCKQGGYESNFKVKQATEDALSIKFDTWVFPGAGYVVTLKKL